MKLRLFAGNSTRRIQAAFLTSDWGRAVERPKRPEHEEAQHPSAWREQVATADKIEPPTDDELKAAETRLDQARAADHRGVQVCRKPANMPKRAESNSHARQTAPDPDADNPARRR